MVTYSQRPSQRTFSLIVRFNRLPGHQAAVYLASQTVKHTDFVNISNSSVSASATMPGSKGSASGVCSNPVTCLTEMDIDALTSHISSYTLGEVCRLSESIILDSTEWQPGQGLIFTVSYHYN
ncbi:unnamed protein product [Protopolystoma xenopodis]|uniref:Uncharacterized protein n=1 Tax=Protopolystoma xenopodis TaxID=117903 RepID=A0A3S5CKL8_9PLAT|nr:unnamed protein product [Protopolystoma xenopodis]